MGETPRPANIFPAVSEFRRTLVLKICKDTHMPYSYEYMWYSRVAE